MRISLEFILGANVVVAGLGIIMLYKANKTDQQIKDDVTTYIQTNIETDLKREVDEVINKIKQDGTIPALVNEGLTTAIQTITAQQITQAMRDEVAAAMINVSYKRGIADEIISRISVTDIADRLATDTTFQDEISKLLATDTVFQDEVSRLLA